MADALETTKSTSIDPTIPQITWIISIKIFSITENIPSKRTSGQMKTYEVKELQLIDSWYLYTSLANSTYRGLEQIDYKHH